MGEQPGQEQISLRDQWGNLAVTIPVKCIVREDGKVWLRKNERGDWELPGGKLDEGEQPEDTVVREIAEELGRRISDPRLVDVYVWKKDFGRETHVELVTFIAEALDASGEHECEGEAGASDFQLLPVEDALSLSRLPEPYKRALRKAID